MTDSHVYLETQDRVIPVESPAQLTLPVEGMPADSAISDNELASLVEAFLLVSPEPATIDDLAAGAAVTIDRIEAALTLLDQDDARGWIVTRHDDRVQLATAPRFATQIRTFLGLDREARLSAAALETLAIIAYRQPVTRTEIESVRGVDVSGVLSTLHARGLIGTVERRATVGNPHQYATTVEFLRHFGIRTLADLPPIGAIGGEDGVELLRSAGLAGDDQVLMVQPESAAADSTTEGV